MKPVRVFAKAEDLATAGALLVTQVLNERLEATDTPVSLVLSGGNTPRRLYSRLGQEAGGTIQWGRVDAFWGDERCVPAADSRSNYGMAVRTGLLDRPFAGVHRIPGEMDPADAASSYQNLLKRIYPSQKRPVFDLVLLGLGPDGHIASLFSGSTGLTESDAWVVPTEVYDGVPRVTMTLPVLASARNLVFLVTGEEKAGIVRLLLSGRPDKADVALPAGLLLEAVSTQLKANWPAPAVTWLLDAAAASLLPGDILLDVSASRG